MEDYWIKEFKTITKAIKEDNLVLRILPDGDSGTIIATLNKPLSKSSILDKSQFESKATGNAFNLRPAVCMVAINYRTNKDNLQKQHIEDKMKNSLDNWVDHGNSLYAEKDSESVKLIAVLTHQQSKVESAKGPTFKIAYNLLVEKLIDNFAYRLMMRSQ